MSDDVLRRVEESGSVGLDGGCGCFTCRDAAAEICRLRLQLERDAATYATMQKGMESQAELADGLKQRCRGLEGAARKALGWLEWRIETDERAGDHEAFDALRAALNGPPAPLAGPG